MISDTLAKVFRDINSKITTTNSKTLRKILKISILFSSKLSFLSHPKNEEILIQNFDTDILLSINPSRSMGNSIYWTGFHEIKELVFLHHFLKKDMVFFDMGANQGEYTLFAAKRLSQGSVFSFEPLPPMLNLLRRNIAQNKFSNITVLPYGLSDKKGELPIHEVKDNEGLATLYPGNYESSAVYNVPLKVVDDETVNYNLTRLDFIKIDIEGAELPALIGSKKVISEFRPMVMVEINETTYRMAGYTSNDILQFFRDLDYVPFKLNKNAELELCITLPSFGNIIFKTV